MVTEEKVDKVVPEELERLLRERAQTNFALVKINFEVGRQVFETLQKYGEEAVRNIAVSYPGATEAFQRYLFNSCRVFRSLKNAGVLYALKRKLGDGLSWSFLVSKCTKAPEGNGEEAHLYWEDQLARIENALGNVEHIAENLDKLPEDVLPQVEGLVSAIRQDRREVTEIPERTPVRKILHVGDEHFGDNELLPDVVKSGEFIVARAREIKPDLIVSSGDILDERQSHDSLALRTAIAFIKELAEIAPVFLLKGTTLHDGVSVRFFESLETAHRVHVSETLGMVGYRAGEFFPIDNYEENLDALIFAVPPATKGKLMANGIVTMKEANATVADMLRSVFETWGGCSEQAHRQGVPVIVSGHGTISGSTASTGQKMVGRDIEVSLGDLSLIKADVVCFAHIHKAQKLDDKTFYCGSIAKLNVGETEDKVFYIHNFDGGLESQAFIIPTRDIISREFEGMPDLTALPEIKAGSLVRICYRVSEEDVHLVDEAALRAELIARGAGDVRIEKSVVPKQMVRAAGISRISSLPDKFRKWCETTGTEVTDRLLEKVALLALPRDVLFLEIGLPMPQRRKR